MDQARSTFLHGKPHPAAMGAPEVTRFLASLAVDGRVAASTQNQALRNLYARLPPWPPAACGARPTDSWTCDRRAAIRDPVGRQAGSAGYPRSGERESARGDMSGNPVAVQGNLCGA